jgi:hypothetical protein
VAIITTIHGDMDDQTIDESGELALIRLAGQDETPDAYVDWVEYRLRGSDEIIHRSVHATIKVKVFTQALGEF